MAATRNGPIEKPVQIKIVGQGTIDKLSREAKKAGVSFTQHCTRVVYSSVGDTAPEPGQRGRVSFLVQIAGSLSPLSAQELAYGHKLEAAYGSRLLATEQGKADFAAEFLNSLRNMRNAAKPKPPKSPKPTTTPATTGDK